MTRRRAVALAEVRPQESVESTRRRLGTWWSPQSSNSKGCEPGWPDCVIVGTKVLYRELKTEAGKLTRKQRDVGDRLRQAGANWRVWRPSDLLSGQIAAELTELADTAELFTMNETGLTS